MTRILHIVWRVQAHLDPRIVHRIRARALLKLSTGAPDNQYAASTGGMPMRCYEAIVELVPPLPLESRASHHMDGANEHEGVSMPRRLRRLRRHYASCDLPDHDHSPKLRSFLAREIAKGTPEWELRYAQRAA